MITNINIYNMYNAIRAIRNSYKSVEICDSKLERFKDINEEIMCYNYIYLGEKDKKLIEILMSEKKRNSERKFLRQILVSMDIKTTLKHWAQIDTYKIGTVRNSESTMHSLVVKNITNDDFRYEIDNNILEILGRHLWLYHKESVKTIKQKIFEEIENILPSGYLLESHWTGSYANIKDMYLDRRTHKMSYWQEFCDIIEKLPYFELLIKNEK